MTVEEQLQEWRKEEFSKALEMMEKAIEVNTSQNKIKKQRDAAQFFNVSTNTLLSWVRSGAPEIRLESNMPLYNVESIQEWLMQHEQ
ncbi:DNA-binding protein [Tetragenococcus halophilus]